MSDERLNNIADFYVSSQPLAVPAGGSEEVMRGSLDGIAGIFIGGKLWQLVPADAAADYSLRDDIMLASCLATGQLLELRQQPAVKP
jgi:hypothetical protein